MLTSLPTHSMHSVLHGRCGPLVVFEAGCGASSAEFSEVAAILRETCRVLLYDRAGCGRSSASVRGRTCARFTSELRELLEARKLAPPYILVGHSFGGLLVRHFALLHRAEVAGVVLVDVSHEEMGRRIPREYWRQEQKGIRAAEGITALEAAAMRDCAAAIRRLGNDLGDLPLTVITGTNKFHDAATPELRERVLEVWLEMQRELAATSRRGRHVIARRAGHSVHRDEPRLVAREILRLVRVAGRRRRDF